MAAPTLNMMIIFARRIPYFNVGVRCNATTYQCVQDSENPDVAFKPFTALSFSQTDQFVVCIYIKNVSGLTKA